jgi:hypothetical protein
MERVPVEGLGVGVLDDPAEVHHRGAVRDVAHRRQIVRNEQEAQLLPRLQIFQQIHDLGADRHIQSRDRLLRTISSGEAARALASAIRCRWPPLNSYG